MIFLGFVWLVVAWLVWVLERWQLHGGPVFLSGPATWHLYIAPAMTPMIVWTMWKHFSRSEER